MQSSNRVKQNKMLYDFSLEYLFVFFAEKLARCEVADTEHTPFQALFTRQMKAYQMARSQSKVIKNVRLVLCTQRNGNWELQVGLHIFIGHPVNVHLAAGSVLYQDLFLANSKKSRVTIQQTVEALFHLCTTPSSAWMFAWLWALKAVFLQITGFNYCNIIHY
jgi:hypothetical protein